MKRVLKLPPNSSNVADGDKKFQKERHEGCA